MQHSKAKTPKPQTNNYLHVKVMIFAVFSLCLVVSLCGSEVAHATVNEGLHNGRSRHFVGFIVSCDIVIKHVVIVII